MEQSAFRALADPSRRRILSLLRKRSMTAGELAEQFDLAKSTLSGHFNVLKEAGLVQEERRGNSILYHLNLSVAEELMAAVMELLGTGRPLEYTGEDNDKDKLAK